MVGMFEEYSTNFVIAGQNAWLLGIWLIEARMAEDGKVTYM